MSASFGIPPLRRFPGNHVIEEVIRERSGFQFASNLKGEEANIPAEVAVMDNYSLFTSLCDADRVMQEIDKTIERGVLDARSAIGDARLNFGQPHQYTWLKLLEQSRKRETQSPQPSLPAEPAAAN